MVDEPVPEPDPTPGNEADPPPAEAEGASETGGAHGARAAFDGAITWARGSGRETVITMLIAFGVAWIANIYIIAVRYEGTYTEPGGAATVRDNWFAGALFWLVLSTLVLTVITYARKVGPQRLTSELSVLPSNLLSAFRASPAPWASFAWGAALSLIVATVFGHAMAGISGLLLLVLAASPLVGWIAKGIRRVGHALFRLVLRDRAEPLASGGAVASTLGLAVGMAVAWQLRSDIPKLVLAAIALVVVFVLLQRRPAAPPAVTGLLVLVTGLLLVNELRELLGAVAFADDGGWQEGGGTLTSWLGSQGSGRVIASGTVGGATSAGGSVLGTFAGNTLGQSASSSGLGGLSGEWGAATDGAQVSTPSQAFAAAAPPPSTGTDADASAAEDVASGSAAEAGTTSAGEGTTGPGEGTKPSGETAGTGGLSGEWTGGADGPPDVAGRGAPPPAAPPPPPDEDPA